MTRSGGQSTTTPPSTVGLAVPADTATTTNSSSRTRVCIKNIPPSFTEEKLKRHLVAASSSGQKQQDHVVITDCRILRTKDGKSRKMAFVGFKTAEMAKHCVSHRNGTYVQTSRITVEYAFSQTGGNNDSYRPWSKHSVGSSRYAKLHPDTTASSDGKKEEEKIGDSGCRAKLEGRAKTMESEAVKKRKEEFLSVMAPRSSQNKAKFWSNDDDVVATGGGGGDTSAPHQRPGGAKSKSKTGSISVEHETEETSHPGPSDYDHDGDADDESSTSSSSESSSDDEEHDSESDEDNADPLANATSRRRPHVVSTMTDMDFLRSKVVSNKDTLSDDDGTSTSSSSNSDESSDGGEDEKEVSKHKEEDTTAGSDSSGDSDSSSSVVSSSTSSSSSSSSEDDDDEDEKEQNIDQKGHTAASNSAPNKDAELAASTATDSGSKDVVDSTSQICPSRLFVRNLPYSATEDELRTLFEHYGTVTECHIPIDDTKRNKGYAFIRFDSDKAATEARRAMDGIDFQGRLMHILPGRKPPVGEVQQQSSAENENEDLTYKQRKELQRREKAGDTTGWSASFVRGDAVVEGLAERLGVSKDYILNAREGSSGDAAVRLALGETHIINENREYFSSHGIDMDALIATSAASNASASTTSDRDGTSAKRSQTMILAKNLPYSTTKEELHKLFTVYQDAPSNILLPPSRAIALVEFSQPVEARKVFKKLAYKRFKHVPLYLEWAPLSATVSRDGKKIEAADDGVSGGLEPGDTDALEKQKVAAHEVVDEEEEDSPTASDPGVAHSVYVKNLNFKTTEDQLRTVFEKVVGVRSVRIPTKRGPVRMSKVGDKVGGQGSILSMGFGFVEFESAQTAKNAIKALQGTVLDGHSLDLKLSSKGLPSSERKATVDAKQSKKVKLLVRNVPFQATRTELLKLFGSYGQLKRVRLPKKFDGTHRGFAFVDFMTAQEAQTAMTSLSRTHLYGRHLVLEWADDKDDLDTLREKAKRDINDPGTSTPMNKKIRFDDD